MSIARLAIKQRVTTVMVCAGIIFFGIIATFTLKKELFPPLNFPQITVVTEYTNAAPEEIETLITRPLEEAISSTSGLRKLESVAHEGRSTIFASFGWKENIDFAALSVREKIDLVKERLPKECEDPIVLKFDPLEHPAMIFSVTGDMAPIDLKILTERILKDNLEKVEGVASATVSGGEDREIQVELDQGRLSTTKVSILDVVDAIDKSNVSYPAGSIKKGLYEYLIRTVGEFRTVPEIGLTVVSTDLKKEVKREPNTFLERSDTSIRQTLDTLREERAQTINEKRLILVRDIGVVKDSVRQKQSISRLNGKDNISVSILKQGSANVVEVADRVRKEMLFLQDEIEARGLQVETVYDHSQFVKSAVNNMRDSAVVGGIIAAFVLFYFFKNWKSAFIVSLSIAISIIGTFFLCQLQGISMNTMSLSGLALGAGMMIDNSIVVIENIFRRREMGEPVTEAAEKGTDEVFWPVLSSTLTTIASFIPVILFVPGVAGQLFQDLSWAIIYSQALSFPISVTLVPMLATLFDVTGNTGGRAINLPEEWVKQIKAYFLNRASREQNISFAKIVGVAGLLFVMGLWILKSLDTEILPKVDQGQFIIHANLPVGSTLEATDEAARKIERTASEIPEVKSVSVTIGSSSSAKSGEVKIETLRSHQALVAVTLKPKRKHSSSYVAHELSDHLEQADLKHVEMEFVLTGSEFGFATTGGKPIEVEIKGYDLVVLTNLAEAIEKKLKQISGISEVLSDLGQPSPETKVEIDRRKAALYAISARDISLTAKAAIEGAVATVFKEQGREIDVRVQLAEKDRQNMQSVNELLVYSNALEVPVSLKEVAAIKQGYGPSEIRRKDQIRTITVRAGIEKGFKEKNVLKQVERELRGLDTPKEYTVDLVGKAREVRESFRRLAFAIALALILNYMIMAAQFESFLQPFVIMTTVPFAIIGVGLALLVTGTPVSIIALLGVLMLAGSVVNNAIVLVDYINQARRDGAELVEASLDASFVRLRPIVISTIAAVVGLVPLALGIGEGAELQAPLAITTIGGLLSATPLTLCVIPSVYILMTRAVDKWFGIEIIEEDL